MASPRSYVLALLVFARLAGASAPQVTPELALSPVNDVPAFGNQSAPAIASNGEDAFAVWTDRRSSFPGALIGSRIGADGTLFDPLGVLLDPIAGSDPQVIWNGREYLVLGREIITGSTPDPTYLFRVSAAGTLVDRISLGAFADADLYGGPHGALVIASGSGTWFIGLLGDDGQIREQLKPATMSFPSHVVADGDDWVLFSTVCSNTNCAIVQYRLREGKLVSERTVSGPATEIPSRAGVASDGNGKFLFFWNNAGTRTIDAFTRQYAASGGCPWHGRS